MFSPCFLPTYNLHITQISLLTETGRGGQIGRARVSREGDRGFETMVDSNQ